MPAAITSYIDPSVEPEAVIGDTLWRCIPAPRGGRRGYSQKLRHLQEGIAQGLYSNKYPFVLPGGHEYARSWGFTIVESVLQGGREWGETESEEEAAESSTVLEPPAQKAKPASPKAPVVTTQVISVPVKAAVEASQIVSLPVQAKPKVRLATSSKGVPQRRTTDLGDEREGTDLQTEAASSENLEPVRESIRPSAVIRPSSTPKSLAKVLPKPPPKDPPVVSPASTTSSKSLPVKAAPEQLLRPNPFLLPDGVLAYERSGKSFEELRSYRNFNGLLPESGIERKFILFLDYHQVLDRGVSESASWSHKIPGDNVSFLRRVKQSAERVFGNRDSVLIFVLSHIEASSRNLEGLLRACNDTKEIIEENLIQALFVTREREGVTGKLATARKISRGFSIPICIVDDNVRVIAEFAGAQEHINPTIHCVHIKLRRKPSAERAEVVRPFLAGCSEDLEKLFRHYKQ